jgi:galactokinase
MTKATVASAPGRVNLMGEHTDYNDGLVLPMPIPQETRVTLRVRDDQTVRLTSDAVTEAATYVLGREQRSGAWFDYVQGLTLPLVRQGLLPNGFDLHVTSDVPLGAGLSSSASLEVAVLRALRSAFELPLDDVAIARLGQEAEVSFVGAPVGIMDQMAASAGQPGSALFLDTRTMQARPVHIPPELGVIVIASGVTHQHGSGDYRVRRQECERAASLLGVSSLRDVERSELASVNALPEPFAKRARHVIEENARVLDTVRALERSDRGALRMLFAASHASQRDDFEVSVPAVNRLVELAGEEHDVIGARLTGGGFGGSVVMLAEREAAARVARRIAERHARELSLPTRVLVPREEAHEAS